ncbi:putative lectin, galactoside-binding, soluble, 9 (galectin 9)-like 1 [Trypoxylus dichotomus]
MLSLNWIYPSSKKCLLLTIFLTVVLPYNLSEANTYIWPLPNGFNDGDMITLKGTLPIGGSRFHINFLAESDYRKGDIFLHIGYRYEQNLIVFNTRDGATWISEERYANTSAVVAGRYFTTLIVLRFNQYMVTTNGRHFVTFDARKASSNIKYLSIDADVNISSVSFESHFT